MPPSAAPKLTLEQMNTAQVQGNTYRGRLLLSCVLNETRGAAVAEDRAAQDGTVRALPPRTEVRFNPI